MRFSYHPDYVIPLPAGHPFPMRKFSELHRILVAEGVVQPGDGLELWEAEERDLRLVHQADYLGRLAHCALSPREQRRMGLPCTAALWRRSRLAVQGTLNAARAALEDGRAANLAGGTHHAFPDRGEGFCVLNDVAVAIRALQRDGRIRRALVVDLDVHQGNGTADIFRGDHSVYTFSMHSARSYPARKVPSSFDIGLPNGTGDMTYLDLLDDYIEPVIETARPDLVFYLAGVDPVAGDHFGNLSLTPRGLAERDRLVLESLQRAGLPVVLLLSGGYAESPAATADLHAILHRQARQVFSELS